MKFFFTIFLTILLFISCLEKERTEGVVYAGARAHRECIRPFPNPEGWVMALKAINKNFEGSTPCALWILGRITHSQGKSVCSFDFPPPKNGKKYENVRFTSNVDLNEKYLSLFDKQGVKVFLQVESGDANVDDLIDLVLKRYRRHRCVAGFGVDVEWHKIRKNVKLSYGEPISDEEAKRWEKKVKSYNRKYKLYFKHWLPAWMPPKYRGDLIFVNDSQDYQNLDLMVKDFDYWAKKYYPNTVFFQIGYGSDRTKLWGSMENPPKEMADAIGADIKQPHGFFWVDFTLREVAPTKIKK